MDNIKLKTNVIDLARLKKGQIIARKYIDFWDRISLSMGSPYTDFTHYAILAFPVNNSGNWLTFNATVKSVVALVPLNRYRGQLVRIYSVKNGNVEFACREASELLKKHVRYEGLAGWSYVLRLLPSLISNMVLSGLRPIAWNKLPNVDSPDRVNCLVLIRRCYPDLIPTDCCASAAAFEQAYRDGKLILEQEGVIA